MSITKDNCNKDNWELNNILFNLIMTKGECPEHCIMVWEAENFGSRCMLDVFDKCRESNKNRYQQAKELFIKLHSKEKYEELLCEKERLDMGEIDKSTFELNVKLILE